MFRVNFLLFFRKIHNTLQNYITVKRNVSSDSTSITVNGSHWSNGAYQMITNSNLKAVYSADFFFSKEVIAGTLLEFNKSVTEIYLSLPQLTKFILLLWFVQMWLLFEKKNTNISWGLADEVLDKCDVFDMISVLLDPHLNH